jgi:REP element-mobilizing transposase RayT
MPRQPREQAAGVTYHVMARATFGRHVFRQNDDRRYFEFRLDDVVRRFEWSVKAHCLMGTHYHLLLTTAEPNLAEGMHRLHSLHAQAFNHRHDEFGHLFRNRYQAVIVEAEGHLLELFRYLALNPVRAGLCRHPAEWRWSSYAAAIGWAAPAPFLDLGEVLALFANDRTVARDRLQAFVEDGLVVSKAA